MNRDLFLAILAMDSYNRGYGEGIKGLNETGQLGNATLLAATPAQQAGWQAASFYAIAYDMTGVAGFADGERVIAYRGTNFDPGVLRWYDPFGSVETFFSSPLWGDIRSGWTVRAGLGGAQAGLALDFYNAVAPDNVDPRYANITTTGHSLGGGLAGLAANDNAAFAFAA